jgi:hypothetical protein
MATKTDVTVRLSAEGREQLVAALRSIGPEGEKMARQVERAGETASRGLLAINAASLEAQGKLDAFAGRLGPVGNVLRAIGPGGLAAAAGLGALAFAASKAFDLARKGMEFADGVQSASERLHVGVEALQEYRLALKVVGDDAADFDAGLSTLLQKMGEFDRTGGGGKAGGVFKQLGLSVRDANGEMKSGEEMLGEIIARVSQLGSAAQQADIASKLFGNQGGNFLNLIQQGGDGVARLRDEMRAMGAVMDASVIRKYAEAESKSKLLAHAMDVQLMQAFVDLAPILNDAAALWLKVANAIGWARDNIVDIESKTTGRLKTTLGALQARRDFLSVQEPTESRTFDGAVIVDDHKKEMSDLDEKIARIKEELRLRGELTAATKPATTAATLLPSGVSDAAQRDVEAIQKLREQIAHFGDDRQKAIDAALNGLSKDASPEQRAQYAALTGQLFDMQQLVKDVTEDEQKRNQVLQERRSILSGVLTDGEKLRQQEEDLAAAVARGVVTQEEANRVLKKAREEYDPSSKAIKQMSEDIAQWSVHTAATVHNVDDLADAVADLGEKILEMILNTVAYAPLQAGIQSGLNSLFGSMFSAGVHHTGGVAGAAGQTRAVDTMVFAGAARAHTGMQPLLGPGEVPIIARRDEGIFTPRQMDNADALFRSLAQVAARPAGGTAVNVKIVKGPGTDVEVNQTRGTDGTDILEVVTRRVTHQLAADIGAGRGPVGSAIEATYGVSRARNMPRRG